MSGWWCTTRVCLTLHTALVRDCLLTPCTVYNVAKFLDEHPGGEEVILDVGGMDASDAFEDVGHSDEAREQLESLLIGTLKQDPNAPPKTTKKSATSATTATTGASGANFGLLLVVVALIAAAVYKFAI